MYLNYYGLYKEPFHITPDPDFLFESPSHKEARATIVYGVEQRKGFIAVTGEVGTGKTTIVRAYLKSLDGRLRPIYVFNPDLSFDELLKFLLHELGIPNNGGTTAEQLQTLHWRLIELYKEGQGILLVIDEAQNMPVETIEKLRMLSNLETTQDKLLQIVLVGQPELDDKLNLHQLRQLRQRIAVRANLRPLDAAESLQYIEHRIECAGGRFDGIFSKAALRAIIHHAKGSPRTLNILCDNVLLAGFGAEQRPIGMALVKEVARDLAGRRSSRQPLRMALGAAAAALVLSAGAGVYATGLLRGGEVVDASALTQVAHAATKPANPEPKPEQPAPLKSAMVEAMAEKPLVNAMADAPVLPSETKLVQPEPKPVQAAPAKLEMTAKPAAVEKLPVNEIATAKPPAAEQPNAVVPLSPTPPASAPVVLPPGEAKVAASAPKAIIAADEATKPAPAESAKTPLAESLPKEEASRPAIAAAKVEKPAVPAVAKAEPPAAQPPKPAVGAPPVTAPAPVEVKIVEAKNATTAAIPPAPATPVAPAPVEVKVAEAKNIAPAAPAPAAPVAHAPVEVKVIEAKNIAPAAPAPAAPVAPAPANTVEPKIAVAKAMASPAPKLEPGIAKAPADKEPPPRAAAAKPLLRLVNEGETLIGLVTEVYGSCNEDLLHAVEVCNPFILDRNMILTGQKLAFPRVAGYTHRVAPAQAAAAASHGRDHS